MARFPSFVAIFWCLLEWIAKLLRVWQISFAHTTWWWIIVMSCFKMCVCKTWRRMSHECLQCLTHIILKSFVKGDSDNLEIHVLASGCSNSVFNYYFPCRNLHTQILCAFCIICFRVLSGRTFSTQLSTRPTLLIPACFAGEVWQSLWSCRSSHKDCTQMPPFKMHCC